MIFAPPGALLVEIFHPDHVNACFRNMAAACGHSYRSMTGLRGGEQAKGKRPAQAALKYTVPVGELQRALS
jgi:hypothetical protein